MCVYSGISCNILLVFWDGNWTIRNKKLGLIGYCFRFCLWRGWIELCAMILVVWKKRICCIDRIVLFHVLFWWVGTTFYGRWGMFPRGILSLIQIKFYIWVVVFQILVYDMRLVLRLGGWIWWFCLGICRCVLFCFYESISLTEFSRVFG